MQPRRIDFTTNPGNRGEDLPAVLEAVQRAKGILAEWEHALEANFEAVPNDILRRGCDELEDVVDFINRLYDLLVLQVVDNEMTTLTDQVADS